MADEPHAPPIDDVRHQIAALRKDLAALRPTIDEILHWRHGIHILLRPDHLADLAAGKPVGFLVERGEHQFEVQLSYRDVSGSCHFLFMRNRSYTLEWPTSRRRECIQTIQKYLKAGATFYRRHSGDEDALTDPQQIVMLDTIASCYWSTSKRNTHGWPTPDNPW